MYGYGGKIYWKRYALNAFMRDKIHVKRITLKTFFERKGLPKAAPYAFITERKDSRKANTLKTFLERKGIVKRNQSS